MSACTYIGICEQPEQKYRLKWAGKELYPKDAYEQKINGWVKVQFDINRYGWTENIKVLSSEPSGVFEVFAEKKVYESIYSPTISKCRPVRTNGVMAKVTYNSEQGRLKKEASGEL